MRKKLYDKINGRDVYLYTIKNGNISVEICDFGARINSIKVSDIDIALGFNSYNDYLKSGTYAGATIGRVANRIAGGRFILNGRPYYLNRNDGANHLHGGNIGFDKKLFTVAKQTASSVTMQYESLAGEENYPGTLKLTVKYTVRDNSLLIEFKAISDKDTIWNPTNHTYFNLDGENSSDCKNNLLSINAEYYTPADNGLIPVGEKRAVEKTPFDFNSLKRIGTDFDKEELKETNGYDHNFILNGEHAAHVESSKTGIKMDVYTDLPCMQLYTGGAIKPCDGKTRIYDKWAGFCLEPQFCPNAINMNGFENPILKAGENKSYYITYKFE